MINLCIYIMPDTDPLSDAVRNWVHFDNLHAMLTKQAISALSMKKTFEERVLSLMGNTKRININSAVLEPATKKNTISLNLDTLEDTLHKYYKNNKNSDETAKIIAFIQQSQDTKTTRFIQKIPDKK